jgi:hypothetical protein
MLTPQIHSEITRLTAEALASSGAQAVVELVTVIRGYADLISRSPGRKDYVNKLVTALVSLHIEIQRKGPSRLLDDLEQLIAKIRDLNS